MKRRCSAIALLKDMIKTTVKLAAAPIYVPVKMVEWVQAPNQYEFWYHDSGSRQDDDCPESRAEHYWRQQEADKHVV